MRTITTFTQSLPQGISLCCRAAGAPDARRRVLLLHGFPEGAFAWDGVLAALASEARVLAPDLRGYGHSSAPPGVAAYRAKHLVADVVALIDTMTADTGAPLDLLVAHDWGGGIAWNLAALLPQRLRQLVIINSPHPGAFQRELRDNLAQQQASAYMRALIEPDAAARLAADGFAALFGLFERFGRAPWLTDIERARYRAHWALGLDGALNWYRASPLRPPADADDRALRELVLPDSVLRVRVPTTVLWGEADHALLPGLLDGLDAWVPDLQIHRHAQASHWIVHEQPEWVIGHLRSVLAGL